VENSTHAVVFYAFILVDSLCIKQASAEYHPPVVLYQLSKMDTKWLLITVLIFCITGSSHGTKDLEVVEAFLEANNVRVGLILFCDQVFAFKLLRLMQKYNIWSAFQDTTQSIRNPRKLFHARTHQIGVIYDVRCPNTEQLFNISFEEHIFNASYHWLMLHDDLDNAKDLLRPQNINWDAEITLTVEQDNETEYRIYDVYNPSYERGGQLNVTFKGVWNSTIRELTQFRIPNKNIHRRNMFGLQFIGSSVVSSC
jgi:hypothetical protein